LEDTKFIYIYICYYILQFIYSKHKTIVEIMQILLHERLGFRYNVKFNIPKSLTYTSCNSPHLVFIFCTSFKDLPWIFTNIGYIWNKSSTHKQLTSCWKECLAEVQLLSGFSHY